MTVAAVVLAAGASRRLGQPKQLLAFRGATLLDATLVSVRAAGFDQVLVTLGASADEVRARVDLTGVEPVPTPDFGTGCSASLRSAMARVAEDADGLVVLLGDQPGVSLAAIESLRAAAAGAAVGVCRYDDGLGHPLWFRRDMFDRLADLHGDKAVWKLVEAGDDVVEVRVGGPVPPDVDTWEDYQALLESEQGAVRS
ncbi:MAG: nucleotidyltransferase family protein [Nocardioidaceae bacterium]